jgi:LmbE family N-acetylglucosaminyl deacetylase
MDWTRFIPRADKGILNTGPTQVDELVKSIEKINPDILFFPSSTDWNRTHLGVYLLTIDALQKIPGVEVTLIETEFWGQIQNPNLMVENSPEEGGRPGCSPLSPQRRGNKKPLSFTITCLDAG